MISLRIFLNFGKSGEFLPTGLFPSAPFAITITVSFVLMSLSTESILNEASTASFSAESSAAGVKDISVTIKQSIVAMLGRIIPAPFAIAAIVPVFELIRIFFANDFAKVSVVIIASATRLSPSGERVFTSSGRELIILSFGRRLPMMPVDETYTRPGVTPSAPAVSRIISFASLKPCRPVHAFALPLLMMMARPLREPIFSIASFTGAAFTLLVVNTPAIVAGLSDTIRARSLSPDFLSPADMPANSNPGTVIAIFFSAFFIMTRSGEKSVRMSRRSRT